MNRKHFRAGQRPTFVCSACGRRTRDTGEGVTHLCAQCFHIAGIDNEINDNDWRPGEDMWEQRRQECDKLLLQIERKGGDASKVRELNSYVWPDSLARREGHQPKLRQRAMPSLCGDDWMVQVAMHDDKNRVVNSYPLAYIAARNMSHARRIADAINDVEVA